MLWLPSWTLSSAISAIRGISWPRVRVWLPRAHRPSTPAAFSSSVWIQRFRHDADAAGDHGGALRKRGRARVAVAQVSTRGSRRAFAAARASAVAAGERA